MGGLFTGRVNKGKTAPVLETYNFVCSSLCQEIDLSRTGLSGVRRMGPVDLL